MQDSGVCEKYLNLGCGSVFHKRWINVDKNPCSPAVLRMDIAKPLPFEDGMFEFIYSSHVLEHFSLIDGGKLLSEAFRMLRAGGVLRVVVPDLENLVGEYLSSLEKMRVASNTAEKSKHEWLVVELFDQFSRDEAGGMMGQMINKIIDDDVGRFIVERTGSKILDQASTHGRGDIYTERKKVFRKPNIKEKFLRFILGCDDYRNLQIGRFRNAGEVHRWAYDAAFLKQTMVEQGASKVVQQDENTSLLEGWKKFALDVLPSGDPRHPHSIYMEAVK